MSLRTCTEWATESYEECSRYEDQGYDSCDDWDDRCCDWWPCSWGCKLITWVCTAWVWVSNIVCVVWTTIVTTVCIAWEIVSILAIPLTRLLELILAIPILGRLIDEILNLATFLFWRGVQLLDALAGLLGIRPLKKLRVCIVILRDENGNPVTSEATLQPAIDAARDIYRSQANIEFMVEGIHTSDAPAPTYALDVECNLGAWGEDLWLPGSFFEMEMGWQCPTGALGRITGLANHVVVFCVRSVAPSSTAGCALGPLVDYAVIEGQDPECLAHEVGHMVGLWHCCASTNLANGTCGGVELDWWQVLIARNSEHVTYI